jgi:hypothetical protein
MITVSLMGGLGNQLFQLFAVLAYSVEHNMPFSFVYSTHLNERKTYWDSLLLSLKPFTHLSPSAQLLLPKFSEPFFHHSPIPLMCRDFCLHGYFQSYKYFENSLEPVLDLINWRETQQNFFDSKFVHQENMTMISMHFRWGDYKEKQNCHPVLPQKYYATALKTVLNNVADKSTATVMWFCEKEDRPQILPFILKMQAHFGILFEEVPDHWEDWEQLIAISCCTHHIIANSSFSWMGAYLRKSASPSDVICYPCRWFGPALKYHNTDDLCPFEWKEIRY